VKRFVYVYLHCIVNNLKEISKMLILPPPGQISEDAQGPWAYQDNWKYECVKTNRSWSHAIRTHLVWELRNLDVTNLGSCWCLQRTSRFGQKELSLPCAWKSLLSVACLVFPFLLASAMLACI